METYLLIVSVALFLGVMGIIGMLENRRRTEKAQFDQTLLALTTCLDVLRGTQAESNAQTVQLKQALAQLQATIEWGANCTTETVRASSAELAAVVEKTAGQIQTSIAHHQKAMDTTFMRAAEQLSVSASARSKELLSETQRTTKAIGELKASLEESVSFGANP